MVWQGAANVPPGSTYFFNAELALGMSEIWLSVTRVPLDLETIFFFF